MNASAKSAKKEFITRIENALKAEHEFVSSEMLEDGIGVALGINFVLGAGTNEARWMSAIDAAKAVNVALAIFNKHDEEKVRFVDVNMCEARTKLLDIDNKFYTMKVVNIIRSTLD